MNGNAQQAAGVFGHLYESGKLVKDEKSALYEGLFHLNHAVLDLHKRLDKIHSDLNALDNNVRNIQARVT